MIETILKTLLIVGVISSVVGVYQFFINPDFLRWGFELGAFASFKRANGIYWAEYLQGSFLLISVVSAMIIMKGSIKKVLVIVLLVTGIVLTFHRATWIITIIVFLVYLVLVKRIRLWQFIGLCVVSIILVRVFLDVNSSFSREFEDSSFVTERLSVDTWTDRIMLYNMALRKIPQYFFFGVGSAKSDIYLHGVMEMGGDIEVASGEVGGIHNFYLLTAFFYGVPTALLLVMFCIGCLMYFVKKTRPGRVFYMISLAAMLIYFLQNIVNMFFLHHEYGLLLAILIGMGVAVYKKKLHLSFITECKETS
jgi:O-antigen ligase